MMTALTIYFIACAILFVGYFIGVYDERHHGQKAAQRELDREMAEYYPQGGYELYDPKVEEALLALDADKHDPLNEVDGHITPGLVKRGYLRRVK